MNREDQRQRRIKFDPDYYNDLKKNAEDLGVNFYTLTEDVIKIFKRHLESSEKEYRMIKPRLDEVIKSIWVSNYQLEEIVEEICFFYSASSNVVIYNAFLVYRNRINKIQIT